MSNRWNAVRNPVPFKEDFIENLISEEELTDEVCARKQGPSLLLWGVFQVEGGLYRFRFIPPIIDSFDCENYYPDRIEFEGTGLILCERVQRSRPSTAQKGEIATRSTEAIYERV